MNKLHVGLWADKVSGRERDNSVCNATEDTLSVCIFTEQTAAAVLSSESKPFLISLSYISYMYCQSLLACTFHSDINIPDTDIVWLSLFFGVGFFK